MPLPRPTAAAFIFAASVIFSSHAAAADSHWVGLWATAQQQEDTPASLHASGSLLREIVRVSHGAPSLRLHLSNEYGREPLKLASVHVALATGKGAVAPGSDKAVRFSGKEAAEIAPGADLVSDAIDFSAKDNADLSVTIVFDSVPAKIAGHPGSRATSFVASSGIPSANQLEGAASVVHWYVLSGVEGLEPSSVAAVVCFGDSITDGHGVDTDTNKRWTDGLVRRLQADPSTKNVTVLNLGIGGNRLLRPGIGPSGLSRLKRDVLDQPGVKWVIVQLGVNDLGSRLKAKAAGVPYASAEDILAGYKQVIDACHAQGIKVAMGTIMPFANASWYSTPDVQADRIAINDWIRASSHCDTVVDFDAALKDPSDPTRLLPLYSEEDHLHPSVEGYRVMATAVPLSLFASKGP